MEMHDFMQRQMTTAARRQKQQYDIHAQERNFCTGDTVWLSIPTAGKLDPRWEGEWIVRAVKSPVNMEISDGQRKKLFTLTVFNTVYCRNSQIPTCQEMIMLLGTPLKMTTSYFLQLLQPRKEGTPSVTDILQIVIQLEA